MIPWSLNHNWQPVTALWTERLRHGNRRYCNQQAVHLPNAPREPAGLGTHALGPFVRAQILETQQLPAAAAVCEDEKRRSDVWKTPSAWRDLTRYSFEKPALNTEYGGPSYKVFEKS